MTARRFYLRSTEIGWAIVDSLSVPPGHWRDVYGPGEYNRAAVERDRLNEEHEKEAGCSR